MKRFLAIALLPILFLLFGCSHNSVFETRLIALEQSVKNTNTKRDLEAEKINLALSEIKKEQTNLRLNAEENEKRISQLESLFAADRPQEKQLEGSITFVKGTTAFISLGKNDGVKLGDVFGVYKARKSKEKIASLKITAVDLASSSGELEEKTQDISSGYFVQTQVSTMVTQQKQERSSAGKIEPPAGGRVVVAMLATFVSMTDKAIMINHNGKEKTFTITRDTQFINEEGKQVKQESMSLKKGDEVAVTTEIDGTLALAIRKGGIPIRIGF